MIQQSTGPGKILVLDEAPLCASDNDGYLAGADERMWPWCRRRYCALCRRRLGRCKKKKNQSHVHCRIWVPINFKHCPKLPFTIPLARRPPRYPRRIFSALLVISGFSLLLLQHHQHTRAHISSPFIMTSASSTSREQEDTNSTTKSRTLLPFSPQVLSYFVAGGVAGATSRTVVSPLERLKIIKYVSLS